jgi:hypothetical protein
MSPSVTEWVKMKPALAATIRNQRRSFYFDQFATGIQPTVVTGTE